ncbi:MAG: MarR family transcriptional regulator [Myxococcales bacterium]
MKKRDDSAAVAPPLQLVALAAKLRIAFALVTRAQRKDVPGKLTAVQLSALYKLDVYGPLRIGDLAGREQVAPPTMSRVVASLQAAGMVKRRSDPISARSSLITITSKGRRQIDAVRCDRTDVMTCRLTKLAPRHQRALAAALPALEALAEHVTPGVAERELERTRRARGLS